MKNKNRIGMIVKNTIKSHKMLSICLVIAIFGAIFMAILPPLVLEKIVDTLTERKQISFFLVVIYFACVVLSGVFHSIKESFITIFGQKVTHELRTEMAVKMNRLQASYFVQNEQGVTVSRFVNDVDTVESLFTAGIISMFVDLCKVLSILGVIFVKSKGLGVLIFVITPLLFFMTRSFQKRMLKAQIENRVAVGKGNHCIPETIQNIRMIHTFQKENYMAKRYDRFIQKSYESMEKSNFYDAIYSPIIITISTALIAIMMVLSARGGAMQQFFGMSVGTAVAVISYVGKVFEPLESIGMEIQNIQSAIAGVYRINEFLAEPERKMPKEEVTFDRTRTAIEGKAIDFGYEQGKTILNQCNFAIPKGENVTLVGRTGIGKSTIFKLILGLYEPQRGEILIYGVPAGQIPDSQKRRLFGYVEQTFSFVAGTIRDQITLKDETITEEMVEQALQLVGMSEVIQTLEQGYDTPCKRELFSQGQIQLLSIARAIVADPEILLLDEITANLDSATEEHILHVLQKASQNRTVFSISHRLYEKNKGTIITL